MEQQENLSQVGEELIKKSCKSFVLIGLSGFAGSGKDYVADILTDNFGFRKYAFADPIKEICIDLFRFSYEQVYGPSEERDKIDLRYRISPRQALQKIGTTGRELYKNIWADKVLSQINKQGDGKYVITDCRYLSEFERIKFSGGKLIRIKRDKQRVLTKDVGNHSSEQEQKEILDSEFDYILNNCEEKNMIFEVEKMLGKLFSYRR